MQKSPKVLIVEDEQDTVELLEELFEDMPYQCEFAQDQRDAVQRIDEWRPDVLLLDLRIPPNSESHVTEKDYGEQVIEHAKNTLDNPKIIVMSGDQSDFFDQLKARKPYILCALDKAELDFDQITAIIDSALSMD
jgi:CheY-like chemotaxis protein